MIIIFGFSFPAIAAESKISISAWVPYWAKSDGVPAFTSHSDLFDEILPFAFEVQPDGTIKDKLNFSNSPYKDLLQKAKDSNVKVIPTFLWTGPTAMKNVFTDEQKVTAHIQAIINLAESINAPGVDIDYEGKRMEDKQIYADFFKRLSLELKKHNLSLSCTIEAVSTPAPNDHLIKIKATAPWSNDLASLNKSCDVVRIMAYDQMPQTTTSTWTEKTDKKPYAPNADIAWANKVIKYNLKFIDKNKLILGVPTYGWDTKYTKLKGGGYSYEIMKSWSYPNAVIFAMQSLTSAFRGSTGERTFTYVNGKDNRIVYFYDAQSIKTSIDTAKKYGLKGLTLFKIDGNEDPALWPILKSYR